MKKKKIYVFGKDAYLLGQDSEGINYYLEAATWDCGWYWGFGYIETYTNNSNPERSKDISSHQHFDSLFFNKNVNGFDSYKQFFVNSPLTDSELWKLIELVKTAYTLRDYSDTLNHGGSNYTKNPCSYLIKNEEEYNRINKIVLPEIFKEIYKILEG